eukprot:765947-Hanusia_phi.AAC.3
MSSFVNELDNLDDSEALERLQQLISRLQISSEREEAATGELLSAATRRAEMLVGMAEKGLASRQQRAVLRKLVNLISILCEEDESRRAAVDAHMLDVLVRAIRTSKLGDEQEGGDAEEDFKADMLKGIINLIPALGEDNEAASALVDLLLDMARVSEEESQQFRSQVKNHALVAMASLMQEVRCLHMPMIDRGLESLLVSCLSGGNVDQLHALKILNVMCSSDEGCRKLLFSEDVFAKIGSLMKRCQQLSIQTPLKLSITMCAKLLVHARLLCDDVGLTRRRRQGRTRVSGRRGG